MLALHAYVEEDLNAFDCLQTMLSDCATAYDNARRLVLASDV